MTDLPVRHPARNAYASCMLTVLVPLYNEAAVLPTFQERLTTALKHIDGGFEILYVDDGSQDGTRDLLTDIHQREASVSVVRFSRNFGKEQAMAAGLRLAQGDAVVVIDADLQDPPELIPDMIAAWRAGHDVVNMRRRRRDGESWIRRATAHLFYRFLNRLSETPIPRNVGDFRLLDRRVVDALNQLPERNRFTKGLFAWVGFDQVELDYDRDPRSAGRSKWSYWCLLNFAIEGITGFSTAPLRLATYAGGIAAVTAFLAGVYFLAKTLLLGDPVQGFPTLIVTVLLLGGCQLMAIGVLGEYLGRLFIESKQRPLYIIDEYQPAVSRARCGPVSVVGSHQA